MYSISIDRWCNDGALCLFGAKLIASVSLTANERTNGRSCRRYIFPLMKKLSTRKARWRGYGTGIEEFLHQGRITEIEDESDLAFDMRIGGCKALQLSCLFDACVRYVFSLHVTKKKNVHGKYRIFF